MPQPRIKTSEELAMDEARAYALAVATETRNYELYGEAVWLINGDPNKPWSLDGYWFLREPMNSRAKKNVLMAAAQIGKTYMALIRAFCDADLFAKNVIYAFEIDSKASQIVRARVNSNIQASEYLRSKCDDVDNVEQKKVGLGFIYFRGARTPSKATSDSADTVILDEWSLMVRNIAELYTKRLNASKDPTLFLISNPLFPDADIDAEFQDGSQGHCHVPCKTCKKLVPLEWANAKATADYSRGWVECPYCHNELDRLAEGEWVHRFPDREVKSWHINGLQVEQTNIGAVLKMVADPDSVVRQNAVRMDQGTPYMDKTSGLDFSDIHNAAGTWRNKEFAPGGYMVVDPGGVFDVMLFAKEEGDGIQRCVWSGYVADFEELEKLEARAQTVAGIIDAGPELKGALSWCKDRANWKRASYTIHDQNDPVFRLDTEDEWLVNVNRTRLADNLVSAIRRKQILFPLDEANNEGSRLVKHMKTPKRIMENDKHGNTKVRWIDDGSPDHQFHCAMYGLLFKTMGGIQKRAARNVRETGDY